MKTTDLALLASFIAHHASAWEAFLAITDAPTLVSFYYEQGKGSWVAAGDDNSLYYFRDYLSKVVAIKTPTKSAVLTPDGTFIVF